MVRVGEGEVSIGRPDVLASVTNTPYEPLAHHHGDSLGQS